MSSIVVGDGAVPGSSSLTAYYAESGTPPGWWLGAGLPGLGDGVGLEPGSEVSKEQLWRLLGMMADPITGQPLGRYPNRRPVPLPQRIATRIADVKEDLSTTERAAAIGRIEAEEAARERRLKRPVAAFDLTFSVPKSVSTVWALADPETQAVIHTAHRDAISIAVKWAEREVVFSRTGTNGVVQEPVRGVVAAAFDHWDSRAGDPHLHTHVVIANRAQTLDGKWRTLDSKTLHRYTVALSELHEGVVQDLLTARLGYAWAEHSRRHSPVPRLDIAGVPTELMADFSQRSQQIAADKDDLISTFAAQHGRHPSSTELIRLGQQATLQTRPDKQHHSLRELGRQWRERAADHVGPDAAAWAQHLADRTDLPALAAGRIDPVMLDQLATLALETVSAKRATFSHGNVLAEVHRQLHGARFAASGDRLQTADHVTNIAIERSVQLNPGNTARGELRLHRGAEVYTTATIMDAETRLLDAGRTLTAPALPHQLTTNATPADGVELGPDQAAAFTAVATSGRRLDLLVGPAGTGKTTSLTALRTAWEDYYGPGSVVGLAPSATAADVLGNQLGITTENTAKWLLEHRRTPDRDARAGELQARIDACSSLGSVLARRLTADHAALQRERDRWTLHPGQLLIIDEASLAGTLALDTITSHARAVGAKVLLVGDPMQLSAVDAGGAFAMLTHDRTDTAELTEPRRFTAAWESDATLLLRAGNHAATAAYTEHDRVHSGDSNEVLDRVHQLWAADLEQGLDSVMIAADRDTVTTLNQHARAHLIQQSTVTADGVQTADGSAGTGDRIVTRHNDRTLRTGDRQQNWVKNGDTFRVTGTHPDGSLIARDDSGHDVRLPADYVRDHVELGYAITAHQAQGRTVDTAHSVISPATTREALYVAATRGRAVNTLNVITDQDPDEATGHGATDPHNAIETLTAVLDNSGADTSAHAALLEAKARTERAEPDHRVALERSRITASTSRYRSSPDVDRCPSIGL